jgi:hypothetical protein
MSRHGGLPLQRISNCGLRNANCEKTAHHLSFSQFAFRLSQFVFRFSPFAFRNFSIGVCPLDIFEEIMKNMQWRISNEFEELGGAMDGELDKG